MPLYEYKCGACGLEFSVVSSVRDYQSARPCTSCETLARRHITAAPAAFADYPPYISPASGKLIEGRRAHLEDLKRTGCRIYEPGETQAFLNNRAAREKQRDAEFGALAEKLVTETAQGL